MILKLVDRIFRYMSVGAICALAYNVVMIGGAFLRVDYVTSFIVSFFIVTGLGYVLHAQHTFQISISWLGFGRFAATQLLGAAISFSLLAVFCSGLGISVQIASPLCTVCLFFWNFASAHWAIGRYLPSSAQCAQDA